MYSKENYLMNLFHVIDRESLTFYAGSVSVMDCVKNGFVVIDNNTPITIPEYLYDTAKTIFETEKDFNNTFHKSFDKVAEASIEELVIEQLIHYCSTYGLESVGMTAMPYIPAEKLELPENAVPSKITIIKVLSADEITDIVTDYFCTVKAPSLNVRRGFEQLLNDYFDKDKFEDIKSFELFVVACDKLNRVPSDPRSALRYIIYQITGATLLVNSHRDAIRIETAIKYDGEDNARIANILLNYDINKMSSIFFNYKKLFLALKNLPGCANYVNKLRRYADKNHKHLNDVCLQNATKLIADNRFDDFCKVIQKSDIFDLIKLCNILKYKDAGTAGDPQVYSIRNGRTFVKKDAAKEHDPMISTAITYVKYYIAKLLPHLIDKSFVLPKDLVYAVPSSGKQMIGNIPWGSYITIPNEDAITMGIAWNNVDGDRVDLDLHMHSDKQSFGWNSGYRKGRELLFTGDMTDATNGAAEAFYFKPEDDETYCLDITHYCGPKRVPFKFCVTKQKPESFDRNYTFDNTELVFPAINLEMDLTNGSGNNMNLGYVNKDRFVFYGGSLSNSIGAYSEYYGAYLEGIKNRVDNMLSLEDLLEYCGAYVYYEGEEDIPEDAISLLPEDLTVSTFTDILTGNI